MIVIILINHIKNTSILKIPPFKNTSHTVNDTKLMKFYTLVL